VADRAAILSEGHLRRIVDLDDRTADTRGLEIQCRALDEAGQVRITSAGYECERSNEIVRVRTEDRARLGDVISMIQAAGGYVLRVAPIRMDLERVFLAEVNAERQAKGESSIHTEEDTREHVRRILDHLVTVDDAHPDDAREEVHS